MDSCDRKEAIFHHTVSFIFFLFDFYIKFSKNLAFITNFSSYLSSTKWIVRTFGYSKNGPNKIIQNWTVPSETLRIPVGVQENVNRFFADSASVIFNFLHFLIKFVSVSQPLFRESWTGRFFGCFWLHLLYCGSFCKNSGFLFVVLQAEETLWDYGWDIGIGKFDECKETRWGGQERQETFGDANVCVNLYINEHCAGSCLQKHQWDGTSSTFSNKVNF